MPPSSLPTSGVQQGPGHHNQAHHQFDRHAENRRQNVRKSGVRVRVAARLNRAQTGYVVWSKTYDRAFVDMWMVQDDIAGQKI